MSKIQACRPIAFCAGLALAWCGTAEAQKLPYCSNVQTDKATLCVPDDAAKVEIDDLKDRVEWLERIINSMLPTCSSEPPEHLPCIERQ